MKYILSILILTLFMTLNAKESYPKLFSQQGTPLYKAIGSFKSLDKIPEMKQYIDAYKIDAKKTKELGFKADTAEDKKAYLKALRKLQKEHDEVIGLSIKIVYKAIEKDKYVEFKRMVNFGISYYEKRPKLRKEMLTYYKKNRTKAKIASLEKLLRYDRSVTKVYDESEHVFAETTSNQIESRVESKADKSIILLSATGCGWCAKLKAFLDKKSVSYRELNIKNSEGARLYRKYNGRGVPMTIIDDKVIRGYSPDKIMREIQ